MQGHMGKIGDCALGTVGCAIASLLPSETWGHAFLLWGSVAIVAGRLFQMFILEPLGVRWPPRPRWWKHHR